MTQSIFSTGGKKPAADDSPSPVVSSSNTNNKFTAADAAMLRTSRHVGGSDVVSFHPPPPVVSLHPQADLLIIAGPPSDRCKQRRVLVSKRLLCAASPVFRAMLDPANGFRESRAVAIQLPADDGRAFKLAMRAVHNWTLGEEWYENVALHAEAVALCDKYLLLSTAKRAYGNLMAIERVSAHGGDSGKEGGKLCIALRLRSGHLFENYATRIIFDSKLGVNGRCVSFVTGAEYDFLDDSLRERMVELHERILQVVGLELAKLVEELRDFSEVPEYEGLPENDEMGDGIYARLAGEDAILSITNSYLIEVGGQWVQVCIPKEKFCSLRFFDRTLYDSLSRNFGCGKDVTDRGVSLIPRVVSMLIREEFTKNWPWA